MNSGSKLLLQNKQRLAKDRHCAKPNTTEKESSRCMLWHVLPPRWSAIERGGMSVVCLDNNISVAIAAYCDADWVASYNRLLCDCRLLWLFDLHNATKNEHLRFTLQQIECLYEPKDNRGQVPISIQDQVIDYSRPHDMLGYDDTGSDYEDPHRNAAAPPYGDQQLGHRSSSSSSSHQFPAVFVGYKPNRVDHYDRNIGPPTGVSQQPSKTINGKQVVTLMKLRKEDFLPCAKELDEPTELPLSRESIGMDPVYRASASSDSGGSRPRSVSSNLEVVVCLLAVLVAVVC
ncbi:AAEL006060-PA [Aedes aegypti]|uniref:AAEL006060-PA n=1 Tax=Aedes aegypti TaxID=7159 RepID=Q177Q2_AEDAE|nr:AAEL006060-PA [Aedes aegypti]